MRVLKLNLRFVRKLLQPRRGPGGDSDASLDDNNNPTSSPDATTIAPFMGKAKAKVKMTTTASATRPAAKPEPPREPCPICHDPVGVANPEGIVEGWASLHCGHRFGTACIQTWLQDSIDRNDPQAPNPSCPICRAVARHPTCGHMVCAPLPAPTYQPPQHHHQQETYQPAVAVAHPRRRVRRRLERRPGHPLRPAFQSSRRMAQTVGECVTCKENAEFDARMQRWAESRRATTMSNFSDALDSPGRTNTGGSSRRASRASGLMKAYIPGLKRSSIVRASVVGVVDYQDVQRPSRAHLRGCEGAGRRMRDRSLTPIPGRRLSI